MQFLYEIFPVFLFFLTFKFYGIYVATIVGIVSCAIQVLFTKCYKKKWDKAQLITLAVFTIFGGMTLYFHNPIFVKWKPTVVFWIFALVMLGSQLFTSKPIIERMLENVMQTKGSVPKNVWKKLNLIWIAFFIILGGVNLFIAYSYSNDTWVNFKFYGLTAAFFIFSFLQALYLSRYLSEEQ